MTKNIPFFPILHIFAPLNDVRVCIAWSWKSNLITWIFFTRMISNFKYKCPHPGSAQCDTLSKRFVHQSTKSSTSITWGKGNDHQVIATDKYQDVQLDETSPYVFLSHMCLTCSNPGGHSHVRGILVCSALRPPFQAPPPLYRPTFLHLVSVLMPSIFHFLKNSAFWGPSLSDFGKISTPNTLILAKICSWDPIFLRKKICSVDSTFENLCGTYPPKKKKSEKWVPPGLQHYLYSYNFE